MARKKAARRRPKPRAKVKRKEAPKLDYATAYTAPRRQGELEKAIRSKLKQATNSALDVAAENPEAFVNSLLGTYEKVKKARQMVKSNPAAAKSAMALLALSSMAKLAKSKLG